MAAISREAAGTALQKGRGGRNPALPCPYLLLYNDKRYASKTAGHGPASLRNCRAHFYLSERADPSGKPRGAFAPGRQGTDFYSIAHLAVHRVWKKPGRQAGPQ